MSHAVTVVGVGEDGCLGLSARARGAVAAAGLLVGSTRQLAFFPEHEGETLVTGEDGVRVMAAVATVAERCGETAVVVLASGDPLFFGIGGLIAKKIGAEHVEVIPQPSSVAWAFARIGVSWQDARVISLHGRPAAGLLARLRGEAKVAVLTDGSNTPPAIAAKLLAAGQGEAWRAWVGERLAGPGERVRAFSLSELAEADDVDGLNVLILLRAEASWRPPARFEARHEDAFAKRMPKRGLITKREVRAMALAILRVRPDAVVWDVGAGSGAVSVEAAQLASEGQVFAIETDDEGAEICQQNAADFGADNVSVIHGRAPGALEGLPAPDAVFVGGSKGSMREILAQSWAALRAGGVLAATAVTFENVGEAYAGFGELVGQDLQVVLLQASRGAKLARYKRYEAHNPIHLFWAEKPEATDD